MNRFDSELRATSTWLNWETDRRHRYAITDGGKLYPVKQIVSMATGAQLLSFGGGTEANGYVESRGFHTVSVQMPTESEVQIALHELLLSRRPAPVSATEAYQTLSDAFHLPQNIRDAKMANGENHWGNRVRFARRKLVDAGILDGSERNEYRLATRTVRKIWLEKSLVEGRVDRREGPNALGKVLWSPQRDRSDGDTYALMRAVQPGDVVLHLTDNQRILGSSIVADYVSMSFTGLENTEWADTKCYMVPLRDFVKCDPPFERADFLGDPALAPELRSIRTKHKNLFYDRDLGLVQGFYFTTVPFDLANLLDRAYRGRVGHSLPHVAEALADAPPSTPVLAQTNTTTASGALDDRQVWIYAPGESAEHWDEFFNDGIMAIGWDEVGDLSAFSDLDEVKAKFREVFEIDHDPMNDALACFEFAHAIRPGDLVFAKRGRSRVIGYGTVLGDYQHLPGRASFKNVRRIRWDGRGDWPVTPKMATKALTDISNDQERITNLTRLVGLAAAEEEPEVVPLKEREPYTIESAMDGLFLPQTEFEQILRVWRSKKNLILQGPPGVGKTHIARRLAYALMGFRDASRVSMIQFHQSYSYEDFVQGYRPTASGLELKDGLFLEFCAKAARDPDTPHIFIIDEINRGNLSRIFGELMMLIEPDKRGSKWSVPLTYASSPEAQFSVSQNVYLLGLMNTADRSLAMVDYALRRRFAFRTIEPQIDAPGFQSMLVAKGIAPEKVKMLGELINAINAEIAEDTANLGRGYRLGHSFFCSEVSAGQDATTWLRDVIETELVPLITEYWVDDTARVAGWAEKFRALLG